MEAHSAELARVLRSIGGGRPMRALVTSEAFAISESYKNSKIPAFVLSKGGSLGEGV